MVGAGGAGVGVGAARGAEGVPWLACIIPGAAATPRKMKAPTMIRITRSVKGIGFLQKIGGRLPRPLE